MLVICNIKKSYMDKNSPDYISSTELILKKIKSNLKNNKKFILVDSDTSLFSEYPKTSFLNIKTVSGNPFDRDSTVEIVDHEGNKLSYLGKAISNIIPFDRQENSLNICGIDYLSKLVNTVKSFSDNGYYILVNPDLVKSFKNVIYKSLKGFCTIQNKG